MGFSPPLVFLFICGVYVPTSNTLTIEDCLFYDDCTGSASEKWYVLESDEQEYCLYNDEYWILANYVPKTAIDSSAFIHEFDAIIPTKNKGMINPLATATVGGYDWNSVVSITTGAYYSASLRVSDAPVNTVFHVKMVKQDNTITLYIDDVLRGSTSATYSGHRYILLGGGGFYAKNVKLKSI